MNKLAALPLEGLCVMVTRPAHQTKALCKRFEGAGAHVVRFPVLEMTEPTDRALVEALVDRLAEFQIAVFVSRNAVDWGMRLIQDRGQSAMHLMFVAVGPGTAAQLRHYGVTDVVFPVHEAGSAAVLNLSALSPEAVAGKCILIFRGEGGRALLGEVLAERGGRVAYAEVYRRVQPVVDATAVKRRWRRRSVDIIVTTSCEGLGSLFDMIGKDARDELRNTQLVVVSPRMVELARALGFRATPVVAAGASDAALVDAVRAWYGA